MRSRSCNNVLFQTPLLEFGGNTGSLSLHPDSGGLFVFPQQLVLADWRPQCQRNLLRREGLRVTCNIFLHLAEKRIYHVRRWTDTFFTGGVMYSVTTTECLLFLFFFFFYKNMLILNYFSSYSTEKNLTAQFSFCYLHCLLLCFKCCHNNPWHENLLLRHFNAGLIPNLDEDGSGSK